MARNGPETLPRSFCTIMFIVIIINLSIQDEKKVYLNEKKGGCFL